MGKIRVLPPEIVGHIAAGEVVERPASVTKELVENSLDAGARRIAVAYEGGGLSLVEVHDDGEGISSEDLPQVFVRHATSKIVHAEDLARVTTLGFRGEALPSIAAVARVRIASRTSDAPMASWIAVEGGKIIGRGEEARAPGTEVVVRDLFFNTPARRKFVRSLTAEGTHLLEILERLALSRPDVAFTVRAGGRLALSTPGDNVLIHALSAVLGAEAAREMLSVEAERGPWRVWGLVGAPSAARKRMRRMYFNVNGRPVRSYIWQRAVLDGYGTRLLRDYRPPFVLFVEGPIERIDPNVHPAKWEVRLVEEDEHLLYTLLREAVARALAHADRVFTYGELVNDRPTHDSASHGFPQSLSSSVDQGISSDPPLVLPRHTLKSFRRGPFAFLLERRTPGLQEGVSGSEHFTTEGRRYSPSGALPESLAKEVFESPDKGERLHTQEPQVQYGEVPEAPQLGGANLIPLLQLFDTYILVAGEREYYLIDQHAAQERIWYEKLLRSAAFETPAIHTLVVPWVFERAPSEAEMLVAHLEEFRAMGVDIVSFGPRRFRVSAVPDWLADERLFVMFLERFFAEEGRLERLTRLEFLDEFLKDRACKAAIKGNQRLTLEEMSGLLAELFNASEPYTCPHGRPTIVRIGREDLERLFRRTVP